MRIKTAHWHTTDLRLGVFSLNYDFLVKYNYFTASDASILNPVRMGICIQMPRLKKWKTKHLL